MRPQARHTCAQGQEARQRVQEAQLHRDLHPAPHRGATRDSRSRRQGGRKGRCQPHRRTGAQPKAVGIESHGCTEEESEAEPEKEVI